MTAATRPLYQCIFVAIDGSDTAELALDHAIRLAKNEHAHLRIAHVVEAYRYAEAVAGPEEFDLAATLKALRHDGRRLLNQAKAKGRAAGVAVETALLEGKELTDRPATLLAAEARRSAADLIVVGTHGLRNSDRVVLGSVAEALIRQTSVPVLLLRPSRDVT
ncbi:MAG TPA: universal stress protein [Burkholderiaceae bacterium]|nr:universal stress protein [Burkholderiaceae bacterium]